jgi:hypothetical protein
MTIDNIITNYRFVWNYNKNAICDDAIFITSCIYEAVGDKIQWSTTEK